MLRIQIQWNHQPFLTDLHLNPHRLRPHNHFSHPIVRLFIVAQVALVYPTIGDVMEKLIVIMVKMNLTVLDHNVQINFTDAVTRVNAFN